MYLTHGSRAGSVEGFGDRDGRRGARGTEDHREVRGIGDSSESLVGSDPGDIAGKQQPRTCRADAAPHDGRRPGRGQEGAGCQRRFPVITARSMDCSSEPGVIVAGAGALPRARRRCEAGKRTHGPGTRACLALLAATALLALAAPAQSQTTTVTQSGDGATWSLVGENTVAAGQQTYTYTLTRTSGSLPQNEYFGFTSDTLEAERFQDGYSDCTGTNYFCFTLSNSHSYAEYTVSNVRFAGRLLTDTSPHVLTLKVATATPTGTTVTLGVVNRNGVPRSGGLQITVGTAPTNTAPTAAANTVTTGEDRAYAFTADDFGFDDADAGATLASVTIVTVPAAGTLALDGTAVLADAVVTTDQIDADMLTFTPARDAHGAPYTTFTFTVNDGTDDSASAYTMTIDVTDAPVPVCGVPDIAGAGRRQIWTSTVTVEEFSLFGIVSGYGYEDTSLASSLLPSAEFSIGSNNYTIVALSVGTDGDLKFDLGAGTQLTATERAALRLHVCDEDLDFSDAVIAPNNPCNSWAASFDWSDPVVTRTLYLSLPANNVATGEPAITGTAQAGQELTAVTTGIMDADGLPSSFTYQWVRVDADGMSNPADITDATAATYTLTAADAGKKIKVQVSFTDELSGEEERTSAAYPSSGTVTTAGGTNTAPTAANKTVTTGEDRPYTFMAGDFEFDDDDAGDTLASVKIVTPPGLGTLALDGTAVMADDVVTKAEIDGDMLTFTPARDAHGAPYTTFTFTVNDGTDDSASAYTMTIDVTDAPLPVCGVPDIAGDGRRQIWTGTVTVGAFDTFGRLAGYGFDEVRSAGTLLPSQSFSIGSNDYMIEAIEVTLAGDLFFSLDRLEQLTDRENVALRLHVCDGDYDFNNPSASDQTDILWNTTLDWSHPVDTRTVYLSLPANNVATGEPAITGTAQAGQDLTADASPIMDTDGLTGVDFTYQWLRVDADGMSNPADITDATAATYTLTAADAGKKIKVQVSFTDELSGEEERTSAAYPSSGTVTTAASTTAPALLSVTVTSTPRKESDTYGAREHIEFSMTFDAPVTVTGAPTFAFDLGGASTATWYAGSGTTTLRFSHAVSGGSSGDEDTNGISWAETAIALNGGTIAGTDNAVAAVLTHVAQSNLAGHKVDGRTTAVTPATVTVAVTSTPTSLADTYGFGETIVITVTASEAVEVEGDPEFEFSMNNPGESSNPKLATYDRTRSSAMAMAFAYTVQAGDEDSDGIWIGSGSSTFVLDVNDRIRTASQQIGIDRSHPEKGTLAGHKVDGSLGAPTVPPDPTAPTLVSATATTLTIEWTHPGDGGPPLTRNFIEYRVEGTTDWTNWYRGETPTPVTRTVIRNLAAATAYDVRVHSTNAIGNSQWAQSATAFSTLAGTAATGAPTITGTAAVGQPLAVDLTGIEDADGLTNASYSYQWVRVDADGLSNPADIADATDATYTLADADLGKTLKVRVTFDDDAGHTETRTSAATATVTPAAGTPGSPTNLSATVGVGQVVLVWERPDSRAEWSHYEYRSSPGEMIAPDAMWQQALSSPGSLNTAYYQLVKGLTSGTTHTFQVRAVNAQGGSAPATVTVTPISQSSCTIDELGDRRLLWQGQLVAGIREIHVDGSIDTGYGRGGGDGTLTPDAFTFRSTSYSVYPRTYEDFLYVLMREQNIDGWYPREEVVDALRVHVCNTPYDFGDATAPDFFSSFGGYRWNVGFNWPAGIERTLRLSLPPNHAATGDPVISGTVQVGQTLTAVTTGIMDEDVLDDVFTYQWVRVDADGTSNEEDITDATDATYTLTADERGKKVKVVVRFVDILGGEETRTSAPTATLPGVTVSKTALTVTEEDTAGDSYTVVLDSQPTATVTVTVAGHAGTDVTLTPSSATLTFTSTTWGTAQTVTVTAGDDADTANDAVALTHSAASTDSDYQGITIAGVAVTVTDNDAADPAVCAVPSLSGRNVIWTGAMTVAADPTFAGVFGFERERFGSLDDQTFTVGANDYTTQQVSLMGTVLTFATTNSALTAGEQAVLRLHVCAADLDFSAAPVPTGHHAYLFSTPGLSWSSGDAITLRLSLPAGPRPPPPPPPVTDLEQVLGVGVAPGNAQLVVTWTVVDNATGYTVQWMSGGEDYNTGDRQAPVTSGSTTRHTIPGLTNGTEYTVRVIATRTGADDGPPSAEVTGTPFTTPGAPQQLSGVPGDEQVMLTWDAPSSDGGSAILRYEYAIDDSGTWIDAGLDLEETVPGLTNGRQYAFEVRAVNSAGPGAPARTAATPLGMPSVPESLTATGGDGEVGLEWTEPADDGGAPVTGYGYRYAAGQAVPEDVTWRDAGTELTATVSGLENETRYAFEVRARNRVGPGETSGTTALPLRLRAELFSTAVLAAEGEALVVGVRRSGRLAFPAHAYIGVTDSALPGVTATEEGRDDGLGRHRLEFAAGAAEATVTVTVAFDGERRQDRVLSATLDSAELEVDGVRRPYELVTPTLVVPVTEGDAALSVADARVQGKSSVLAFTVSLDRTRDVVVRVDYATEDGSARAGEGYTPVSGTLVIEAGGRERTVEVPVLPALHVTGERTLTLRLSNAVSAVIDDGVATGVIVRESELPKAWLARFGRTASDHAAQAIARRLEAGQRETQVTVAGRRVDGLSVDGLLLGVLPSGGWRPASAVEDMATRLAAPALAASGAPFGGVDADPGTPGLRAGTWGGAPGALDREPFADAGQTLRRAVLPDFGYRLPGAEEALMGTSFYVERGAQQDVGGGTWAAARGRRGATWRRRASRGTREDSRSTATW